MGSPLTHRGVTCAMASSSFPVLALDYRLAPKHRFPSALEDVVSAYEWLLFCCKVHFARSSLWNEVV